MKSPIYELEIIPGRDIAALEKFWGGEIPARSSVGERPVVLVVDMTEGFVRDRYPTGWAETGEPCAAAISELLAFARMKQWPTVFTTSEGLALTAEVGGWIRGRDVPNVFPFNGPPEVHQIAAELEVLPRDFVIRKAKPSAFFGTQLASILIALRADSLIVTGMVTSGCIRATVNDAFSLNYPITIPVECVADRSQASHQVGLFDMGAKYADLVHLEQMLCRGSVPG